MSHVCYPLGAAVTLAIIAMLRRDRLGLALGEGIAAAAILMAVCISYQKIA